MKNLGTFFSVDFIAIVFFLMALDTPEPQEKSSYMDFTYTGTVMVKDHLSGGWEYTVQGAPEGYEKGFLLIIGEKGSYQVQVQTGGGTFIGKNVVAKKNTISFTITVEGENVSVTLSADGSQISGKSISSQGEFLISGTKTLSQG